MTSRIWTAAATVLAVFIITGAPAWADEIMVNTEEDLLLGEDENAQEKIALEACLTEGTGGTAGGSITGAETTVNGAIDANAGEDKPNKGKPDLDNTTLCSFRMALVAARATTKLGVGVGGVTITGVETATAGDKIVFKTGVNHIDLTDPAPLPVIDESNLVIDGCGGTKSGSKGITSPTKPCTNIEFGETTDAMEVVAGMVDALPNSLRGLTVAGVRVKITGIAFEGGMPAIYVPPPPRRFVAAGSVGYGLEVTNCYFGLDLNGNAATPPEVAIQLSGDSATIGGVAEGTKTLRNVFAQGDTAIRVAGATSTKIQGNYFGTDGKGKVLATPTSTSDRLKIGVEVFGIGADGTGAADALDSSDGAADGVNVPVPNAGSPGSKARDDVEANGTVTLAESNEIGGILSPTTATSAACDGPCNVFAGIQDHAIDVGGESITDVSVSLDTVDANTDGETVGAIGTVIKGNYIGLNADATGSKTVTGVTGSGNGSSLGDGAIRIRNGSRGTTIGGNDLESNLFWFNKGPGVHVDHGAGLNARFDGNTGQKNSGIMFALGSTGVGNDPGGPHRGLLAPEIKSARSGAITGTAGPNDQVTIYRVPADSVNSSGGDIAEILATVSAKGDGTWSSAAKVAGGSLITAAIYRSGVGSSELAKNFQVEQPQTTTQTNNNNNTTTKKVESGGTPPPPPPPPPVDKEKPKVVTILGKPVPEESSSKPGAAPPTVVVKSVDKGFSGQTVDNTGVKRVQVAISLGRELTAAPSAVKKAKKKKAKKRAPRCRWVDFKRGRVILRSCAKPLYFTAKGTTKWRLPLNKKTKKLLKGKKKLDMYVKVADVNNNVSTKRYTIKVGRRAVRGS